MLQKLIQQFKLYRLLRLLQSDPELLHYLIDSTHKLNVDAVLVTHSDDYQRINVNTKHLTLFSIQCRNGQLFVCPAVKYLVGGSAGIDVFHDAVGICDELQQDCGLGFPTVELDFQGSPVIYLAVPISWSQANRYGLRDTFVALIKNAAVIAAAIDSHYEHVQNLKAILAEGHGDDDIDDGPELDID